MSNGTPSQPATYGRDPSCAKFSVARYQRMIEVGILTSADKVELLENYIVCRLPIVGPRSPRHDGTVQLMSERLRQHVPAGWSLRILASVELSDSQPEPDFSIVRGGVRTYMTRHPSAANTGLLIETADASLDRDQRDKARIYARAGVVIYWIVNLVDRRIEVHTDPSGPTADPKYATVQHLSPGDSVPLVLDGTVVATIPVADLLP
ncbi:MAG TPA: Uma2 family endonuclease [Gemmataceae bacterium]|jgi:Uma2 family endonuclease|nr:Uma2 family endonuclease [Gemmataceae bacterium]